VFFFCKKKTEMRTKLICPKCNVEAWTSPHFKLQHTKLNF
jgi:hypothetical protein